MPRGLSFGLVIVAPWATSMLAEINQSRAVLSGPALSAFSYFEQVEGHRFDEFLHRLRSTKISPEQKERLLQALPPLDIVEASPNQRAKLALLTRVLEYHERKSVVEIKILRATPATAAFLDGAAILITKPAVEILSAGELQATVAHELGHEYFSAEFELARRQEHFSRMQELELRCDGIAVITLKQLGLNTESLIMSTRKLLRYNRSRFNKESGAHAARYVLPEERERFIRLMIALVGAAPKTRQGKAADHSGWDAATSETVVSVQLYG